MYSVDQGKAKSGQPCQRLKFDACTVHTYIHAKLSSDRERVW